MHLKGNIEERAVTLAQYIIENRTTVRAAAKKFGISKSTVHTVVPKWNGFAGRLHGANPSAAGFPPRRFLCLVPASGNSRAPQFAPVGTEAGRQ